MKLLPPPTISGNRLVAPIRGTRLRILFLNHNVVRSGGTFYRAFDIARHLVSRGHDVTILSISRASRWKSQMEETDGVRIVHTPDLFVGIGRSGWDFWDTLWRVKYVLGREWDIVHAWDCRPAVILPALAARYLRNGHSPTFLIDWCDWWGRGGTQMERGGGWTRHLYNGVETFFEEMFRRCGDASTVITTALFDRAVRLGVPKETIHLLPQGCDDSIVEPPLTREAARVSLEIAGDAVVLISIGVLNSSDAALLFETARIVRRKNERARFVIIGRHRAKVPSDLARVCIQELGYVPDDILRRYMAAADAVIVPLADTVSSRGRWPSKVNFCLSRGVAVVITRVGDLPALLEREGAAFVADPEPADIAHVIERLIADPAAAHRVRTGARRVAREVLPWPRFIDLLETIYVETSARQAATAALSAS